MFMLALLMMVILFHVLSLKSADDDHVDENEDDKDEEAFHG